MPNRTTLRGRRRVLAYPPADHIPPARPRTRITPILLAALTLLGLVTVITWTTTHSSGDDTRVCVYSDHSITALETFTRLAGRPIDCALVYNDAATTWDQWDDPWYIANANPDTNWSAWKTQAPTRSLIIAASLVPQDVPGDWRQRGAAGEYDTHFTTLARNLVAAGLGTSIIRLAHEGNGQWFHDWFGDNGPDQTAWKTFWARAVRAMRTVPGAHFTFDWNIAAGFDTVPLSWYYPGDDVVDVIGFDYYDLNLMAGTVPPGDPTRWHQQYTHPNGPATVLAFAQHHHKPLSIPEWGLVPTDTTHPGGGDDPAFVHGIASIIKNNRVIYAAYFDDTANGTRLRLADAPKSLTAYHQDFAP